MEQPSMSYDIDMANHVKAFTQKMTSQTAIFERMNLADHQQLVREITLMLNDFVDTAGHVAGAIHRLGHDSAVAISATMFVEQAAEELQYVTEALHQAVRQSQTRVQVNPNPLVTSARIAREAVALAGRSIKHVDNQDHALAAADDLSRALGATKSAFRREAAQVESAARRPKDQVSRLRRQRLATASAQSIYSAVHRVGQAERQFFAVAGS